ncbi:MAG: hypothetical protein MI919_34000, partial [Holophagales bacterium]|nr:hypothetical protein [Holophagales bacterium]
MPWLVVLVLSASVLVMPGTASAAPTAFTYQGEVLVAGEVFSGPLDMEFALFNAPVAGGQVGSTVAVSNVSVVEGLFEVELDFGTVWDGTAVWLEVRIKDAGSAEPFLVLDPRQPTTSAPGAVFSLEATGADTVDGRDAFDLAIQGVQLDGTVLRITEGSTVFSQDLSALTGGDADMDPTNELNTGLGLSGTDLQITDAGGTLTVDLSTIPDGVDDADPDPTNEAISSASLVSNILILIEGGQITNMADLTALLNTTLMLDGTDLELTDGGGTLVADLSPLQDGVDDPDADPTNELNTSLTFSGTDLELTDAGGTLVADLSGLPVDDADADPTNELITDVYLTNANDTLEIVEGGLTNAVDVTALQNASVGFDGTSFSVTDGGGTLSV